jgi:hypothetical protein
MLFEMPSTLDSELAQKPFTIAPYSKEVLNFADIAFEEFAHFTKCGGFDLSNALFR